MGTSGDVPVPWLVGRAEQRVVQTLLLLLCVVVVIIIAVPELGKARYDDTK